MGSAVLFLQSYELIGFLLILGLALVYGLVPQFTARLRVFLNHLSPEPYKKEGFKLKRPAGTDPKLKTAPEGETNPRRQAASTQNF